MSSRAAKVVAATGAGIAGVSVVTGYTYTLRTSKPPRYSAESERFDPSTFTGRFNNMLLRTDASTLMASTADIAAAKQLLQTQAGTDAELWRARQIVDCAVHPESGDVVPQPARMSGYVPYNGPVCVAMIASTSQSALLLWNWVNQSLNAAVNYCNRAGAAMDTQTALLSYSTAVATALGVVYGMTTAINRWAAPSARAALLRFTAFPACVIASSANCYIVRKPEIGRGIPVLSEDGSQLIGGRTSSEAARKAVNETVVSRMLLQVPVYFVPACLLALPPFTTIAAVSPAHSVALSTFVTIVAFGFGLPAAIAYYPSQGSIRREELEEELRPHLPETVYYYKGL
eukprot:TRINITY_DN10583_c0_g1_i1.p1 TRINITY_DN10583_c0_g1~~TRINITY_DN10583_c0_g1_i1.p1  ORF type:complete len:344 (+),score=84.89 TRINITY_DN10583_c0_g1_i1:73-1104(+)